MRKTIRIPYFRLLPLCPRRPFNERATITTTSHEDDEEWLVIDWKGMKRDSRKWLCRINYDADQG